MGERERGRGRGAVVRWQKCRRKVDVAVGFHFDVDGQTCVASRIFFEEREKEREPPLYRSMESFDHEDFK